MKYPYESLVMTEEIPMFMLMTSVKYIALHWHDRIEFVFVLQGKVNTIVGQEQHLLKKNDLILINSNEVHGVESTDENKLLVLQIPISFIKKYYSNIEEVVFHCQSSASDHQKDLNVIRELIVRLMLTIKSKGEGFDIKSHSLLLDIIYNLISKYKVEKYTYINQNKDIERLTRITNYIQENYMHGVTLNEIAELENLTAPYLSRYFHQHIGQSFVKYLNSVRLEHAVRYITETDWPIIQIAMESGFTNLNTFHKLFKDTFKTTPYKYRIKHQINPMNTTRLEYSGIENYQFNEEYDVELLRDYLNTLQNIKN
ncbi:helix-turn-helix domain-containing protein [Gracilibacillus sp. YIM 98692]|uniref:AraC family transcriptional regulator n=1 Tax=Gracilibacillus sp. YIM 98692 TaxID=2663532 RepID=UPI0013CF4F07|nr:helix-turn-helix domain-containing protein [Gracilibacillus sp. YIM 98692]